MFILIWNVLFANIGSFKNAVSWYNDVMSYFHQEEEKRIASVMARKEEEKKKEISKLAVLKVVFSVNFLYSL